MEIAVLSILFALSDAFGPGIQFPTDCDFIVIGDTFSSPAYALDVCNEFKTNGVISYRQYVCDSDVADEPEYYEEIYQESGCKGTPITTRNISGLQLAGCGNVGTCDYINMKQPCDDDDNYGIYPWLAKKCILGGDPFVSDFTLSYHFDCDSMMIIGDTDQGVSFHAKINNT